MVFLLITFEGRFLYHSSKIKSHEEVTKQYKEAFFLLFGLMIDGSDPDPYLLLTDPNPGGPKLPGPNTQLFPSTYRKR